LLRFNSSKATPAFIDFGLMISQTLGVSIFTVSESFTKVSDFKFTVDLK
jgi:hypothetical protein